MGTSRTKRGPIRAATVWRLLYRAMSGAPPFVLLVTPCCPRASLYTSSPHRRLHYTYSPLDRPRIPDRLLLYPQLHTRNPTENYICIADSRRCPGCADLCTASRAVWSARAPASFDIFDLILSQPVTYHRFFLCIYPTRSFC